MKKKFTDIQKYIFDVQSHEIYDNENVFEKSLHILEDVASGVKVGDIEQAIV